MNIGICGLGVVGSALSNYLVEKTGHDIFRVDPALGLDDDLSSCDVVFISVPVPVKGFKADLSILKEAIKAIPHGMPLVIRSTILPGTCHELEKEFGRSFSHIPEFLTERSSFEDMINAKYIYLGLGKNVIQKEFILMMRDIFPEKEILPMDAVEAEIMKYAHNLHGAVKVTYWNIIYDICKKNRANFDLVRLSAVNATGFINPMHTFVPGPDKKRGFAGKCFPVNLESMIGYLREKDELAAKFFEDVYCLNRIQRGEKDAKQGMGDKSP